MLAAYAEVTLNVLLAHATASVKQQLAYRFANWAGLFTNTFFLFFRAYALRACYEGRTEIGGLTASGIVAYVTVTQALLMVIPQWSRFGLAANIRSGQIATDLTRPIGLLEALLAVRAGVTLYYFVVRFLPLMVLGAVAGFVSWPNGVMSATGFMISVVLGAWLANLILILLEASAFWFGTERGLRYLVLGLSGLFSGLILPISFLPDSVQAISRWLPFEYTLYWPTRVYLGLPSDALLSGLLTQALWVVLLTGLTQATLALGTRRLVVQGG